MSTYVPDISSKRWVIVSPQRLARPDDSFKHSTKEQCPFCPGCEKFTKDETYRVGGKEGDANWKVRVVLNKYPITDFHEVIIHSPTHDEDFILFSHKQIETILATYRERFNFYKKKGQVLIFCNHGEHAGASQKHSHAQLVVVPSQIAIDAIEREPVANIVKETELFTVYCPSFSQWPYEVWIAPKHKEKLFGDVTEEEMKDLAPLMKEMITRHQELYESHTISSFPFGYNFYIYPKEGWYLRIIPRFVHRAGFELGTGLMVNIVDPVQASLELKGQSSKVIDLLEKLKSKAEG